MLMKILRLLFEIFKIRQILKSDSPVLQVGWELIPHDFKIDWYVSVKDPLGLKAPRVLSNPSASDLKRIFRQGEMVSENDERKQDV